MMKLNNKGQSLVLFIVIVPILLGIMALVIDVGNALSKKNEIDNVIEFVLDYGLDNSEVFSDDEDMLEIDNKEYFNEDLINWKDDLEILLNHNLKMSQNDVVIKNKVIFVTSRTYVDGIFSNILNFKGFPIESEYKGYIENNKEIIQKVK